MEHNDINEHLDTLTEAIERMELRNLAMNEKTSSNDEDKWTIINERSFAYELYRQWMETKSDNLVVNAEVTKIISDKYRKLARIIFHKKHYRFYPDMVLHHSQADSDAQEIICEIKLKSHATPTSITKDIKKLSAYTTEDVVLYHPFKLGVFIFIDGTLDELMLRLREINLSNIDMSRIKFICCPMNAETSGFDVQLYDWSDICNTQTTNAPSIDKVC